MTQVHTSISSASRAVLEPLCDETKRLLKPIHLYTNDRLDLKLDKTGSHFIAEVYGVSFGMKVMPSHAARTFGTRVPECSYVNTAHTVMSLGATDITALLINALWPPEQLEFTPEARIIYDSLLLRWMHQSVASKERADYKINGVVPKLPETFVDHSDLPANTYQQVALATSIGYDSIAYLMQQGTGKTPTFIKKVMAEAIEKRMREPGSCYNVIVAVPKNVRMNWQREVHKFATLPGRVTVLRGGQLDRISMLCKAMAKDDESFFSIVICSYETVKGSWDAISMIPWDLAGADESHFMKNPNSKRIKAMLKLRDIARRRCIMTGTSITNSVMDLYSQLEFLGEGYSGFVSYKRFRGFYAKFVKNEYTKTEKIVGYQNIPFLQERLARLAFMITKKEALPFLPEKSWDVVEVTMTKDQVETYVALQEKLVVEIEGKLGDGEPSTMTVNNVLTMMLRLAQITAGYAALDGKIDPVTGNEVTGKSLRFFTPNPKLEQLVTDLKNEPPTTKTIVWTTNVPVIRKIGERLTAEGIGHVTFFGGTSDEDREEAEKRFNNDDACRVFIGNPQAGGVGLNLWGYNPDRPDASQMQCDHVIRYSANWSMVQREQSEDRCHRIGTRKAVRYTDYIVPGTIDEEILARVTSHRDVANTIQDVRDIMSKVLSTMPKDFVEPDMLEMYEEESNSEAA